MNSKSNSGNILFIILIAVALFAAITYAVTQSTRSGSGNATNESKSLDASDLIAYAGLIQSTIQRMVVGGCSLSTIDFLGTNGTSPSNGSCNVFNATNGGKLPARYENKWWADPGAKHLYFSDGHPVANVGSGANEITMMLIGADSGVCDQINKKAGITSKLTGGFFWSNPPNGNLDDWSNGGIPYNNHWQGCFNTGSNWPNNTDVIYFVLVAR